jgi:hypothetical protein
MENVYDLINEFYSNDEDWNLILAREDVENYFRKQAWQGLSDDQMKKEWSYLVMLCIYMENGEITLNEMTEDTLVDCIAWCARYVSDFSADYENIRKFLDCLGKFFVFMKETGRVESSLAPYLAKQQLLQDDGSVAILEPNGDFKPGEEAREEKRALPPEGMIFLHAGEDLNGLMNEIHMFFQNDRFNYDFERAVDLFKDSEGRLDLEGPQSDKFWRGFWDYFLFDYHTSTEDVTPLTYFCRHAGSHYEQLARELTCAHVALFQVVDSVDEDRYLCRDFMDGSQYVLNLRLDPEEKLSDLLLTGNIFDNHSLGMNYLQHYHLAPLARRRLKEVMQACLDWYRIQNPGASWHDFMNRHALTCYKVLRKINANPASVIFPYQTKMHGYEPLPLPSQWDNVEMLLARIMNISGFSQYDLNLSRHLWIDYLYEAPSMPSYPAEIWASGILENFLEINEKRAAQKKPFFVESLGKPFENVSKAYMEIRSALKIEASDPRYLNEKGYLMMFSPYA